MASWNPGSGTSEETAASDSISTPTCLWEKASDFDFGHLIRLLDPDDLRNLYYELSISPRDVETEEKNAMSTDVGIKARAVLSFWRRVNSRQATRQAILDALERSDNIEAKENLEDIWNGRDIQKVPLYNEFYAAIESLESEQLAILYQSLGLTEADVHRAEMKVQSRDIHLKARSVIRLWKKKNGKKATLDILHEAVQSCRLSTSSEKETLKNVPGFNFNSVKKQLQEEYIQTRGKLPLLPGVPDEFANMEDLFVDLTIVEDRLYKKTGVITKELKSYGDLVSIQCERKESRLVKRILVRGDPGAGKSSTISKLAYDWACGNQTSPISKFELVFAITINEIDTNTDLINTIQDQLLPKIPRQALEDYLQSNASSVVILLDGYDEASEYFHESRDITDVLCSKWLAEACVIVTTRPNQVSKFSQNYGPYVQVQVNGFSKDHREEYVKKFMQLKEGNASAFLSYISKSLQLSQLAFIPIILSMLCLIWVDDGKLPTTITALYMEVILHLGKHAYKKKHGDSINVSEAEKWSKRVLTDIGRVALEGLFEDRLVFKSSEFDQMSLEEACLLGIVTKESKRFKRNMTCNVTFLHKTFQELCAAFYWRMKLGKMNVKLFKLRFNNINKYMNQVNIYNVFQIEYLLRFACGLSVEAAEIIIPYVVKTVHLRASIFWEAELHSSIYWEAEPELSRYTVFWNAYRQMPIFLLYEAEMNNAGLGRYRELRMQLKSLFSVLRILDQELGSHEFKEVLISYNTHCEKNVNTVEPSCPNKDITLIQSGLSHCIPTTSISEFYCSVVECTTNQFASFLSIMTSLNTLMLSNVTLYGNLTCAVPSVRRKICVYLHEHIHIHNCDVTSLRGIFLANDLQCTFRLQLHCHECGIFKGRFWGSSE